MQAVDTIAQTHSKLPHSKLPHSKLRLAAVGMRMLLVVMFCGCTGTQTDSPRAGDETDSSAPSGDLVQNDASEGADMSAPGTESRDNVSSTASTTSTSKQIVFQSTRDNAPGPFCGTLLCSECPPQGTSRKASDPLCASPYLRCNVYPHHKFDCSRCKLCGGGWSDGYWGCQLCDRTPTDEIYVMNADGSGQTRVTSNAFFDKQPDLSSDGSRIVFVSDRDGNDEIYSMKIDGSEVSRLTNTPDVREEAPDWSPTGAIVYVSNRDGNDEIYSMKTDGSEATRLTNSPERDSSPMFSPDGKRIVFVSERDGNEELYVMNADGSAVTRLTDTTNAREFAPAFMDNGKRIIFVSDRDGNHDIYTASATNGSAVTRLTATAAAELSAAQMVGGGIVFASDQDGVYQLYSMANDGTAISRLTNNVGADRWPRPAVAAPDKDADKDVSKDVTGDGLY